MNPNVGPSHQLSTAHSLEGCGPASAYFTPRRPFSNDSSVIALMHNPLNRTRCRKH